MTRLADRHCEAVVPRLDAAAGDALLLELDGWTIEGDRLARTFRFPDYHRTMAFVNLVAWVAHREDHHPEMQVTFDRCRVVFDTHSVGGLSVNDFICAARIDAHLAQAVPDAGLAMIRGEIVAAYGRQFLVETDGGEMLLSVARGKRTEYACGDRVEVVGTSPGEAVIEALDPRASLFFRASRHRMKLMAANVTQVALVTAVEPSFSDELLCRAIVRAAREQLRILIVLNKTDLPGDGSARPRLAPFMTAGYPVIEVSAHGDVSALRAALASQRTVLVGQSGMGKSTLVNALFPDAHAATSEISTFLAGGRHTTTNGRVYRLPEGGSVIDCPGLQEFGLADLRRGEIEAGFVELRDALGHCRFADCRHRSEPDCAVKQALAEGRIDRRRFELLQRIVDDERAA